MRRTLLQLIAGAGCAGIASAAGDAGGLTATLTPAEARPGDLVTLQVAMDRGEYGEFVLDFPAHSRLRIVSRERIPLRLDAGRYRQGERLVLQTLSSGPLVIAGITAQLTELEGVRVVDLPEMQLTVLAFDSADENPAPEPFPEAAVRTPNRFPPTAAAVAGVLAVVVLLAFYLRSRPGKEDAG